MIQKKPTLSSNPTLRDNKEVIINKMLAYNPKLLDLELLTKKELIIFHNESKVIEGNSIITLEEKREEVLNEKEAKNTKNKKGKKMKKEEEKEALQREEVQRVDYTQYILSHKVTGEVAKIYKKESFALNYETDNKDYIMTRLLSEEAFNAICYEEEEAKKESKEEEAIIIEKLSTIEKKKEERKEINTYINDSYNIIKPLLFKAIEEEENNNAFFASLSKKKKIKHMKKKYDSKDNIINTLCSIELINANINHSLKLSQLRSIVSFKNKELISNSDLDNKTVKEIEALLKKLNKEEALKKAKKLISKEA